MSAPSQLASVMVVLAQQPDLCIDGFRFSESDDDFPETRDLLMQPDCLEQIATACEYINRHGIDPVDSYTFKHYVERWREDAGLSGHVANGCAIVAATLTGYKIVREKNSPNCRFTKS